MTQTEALRLALEALEEYCEHGAIFMPITVRDAIKAALEAKDEPVAWVYPEFWQHLENLNCGTAYRLSGIGRQPLYTTPPQRKPLTDEEISDCMEMSIQKTCRAIETKLKWKNT